MVEWLVIPLELVISLYLKFKDMFKLVLDLGTLTRSLAL